VAISVAERAINRSWLESVLDDANGFFTAHFRWLQLIRQCQDRLPYLGSRQKTMFVGVGD
jgi:hypothetical protein